MKDNDKKKPSQRPVKKLTVEDLAQIIGGIGGAGIGDYYEPREDGYVKSKPQVFGELA